MPSEKSVYQVNPTLSKNAYISSFAQYQEMYQKSIDYPEEFWGDIATQFYWETPIDINKFFRYNFDITKGPIYTKWLDGATTNISYNLLDRNIKNGFGDKIAFYWEGNHPDDYSRLTYKKLLEEVCRLANVLKSRGIKKGDRVTVYMPMILETVITLLACARIGAVHSLIELENFLAYLQLWEQISPPEFFLSRSTFEGLKATVSSTLNLVNYATTNIGLKYLLTSRLNQDALEFAGFSADSFAERILDCEASVLITADGVWRGQKLLSLKNICDQAMNKCTRKGHHVKTCIVVSHLERVTSPFGEQKNINNIQMQENRDFWWHEVVSKASTNCYPEWVQAEDPLFMLYTSGSTGKPKGVVHTTGGYLLYAATTFKYVFDYKPVDVYWCTADIGWITGHTYVVYGPLANAATSVLYEGTPFYPNNDRFWLIVQKYRVSQFYTAPTAIRALMKFEDQLVKRADLSTLKVLGSVGEPINPEAWLWYYKLVGREKCSIVDTFWQTETGGHVLTPLPGATPMKPGAAAFPFFGVQPALLDESGKEIKGEGEGFLVFARPWPGIMRTLYNNHERYETTYFSKFPGYYCTGDGARRDADGYLWVTGRIDDMLNVSGHLMSTAEVESVLTEHTCVAEAAVVSKPHPVKGECLYCFVTTVDTATFDDNLVKELKQLVRERIGPFAQPDVIQNAPMLPKTRSGKIMRRILRKIAVNDRDVGDITTLADSNVVEYLFANRPTNA